MEVHKSIIKKTAFATLTNLNVWLTEERYFEIEITLLIPPANLDNYGLFVIYFREIMRIV
jgi:hypothetical protein